MTESITLPSVKVTHHKGVLTVVHKSGMTTTAAASRLETFLLRLLREELAQPKEKA